MKHKIKTLKKNQHQLQASLAKLHDKTGLLCENEETRENVKALLLQCKEVIARTYKNSHKFITSHRLVQTRKKAHHE